MVRESSFVRESEPPPAVPEFMRIQLHRINDGKSQSFDQDHLGRTSISFDQDHLGRMHRTEATRKSSLGDPLDDFVAVRDVSFKDTPEPTHVISQKIESFIHAKPLKKSSFSLRR